MRLPRNSQIWGLPYLADSLRRAARSRTIRRAWLTITDHYEPYWRNTDDAKALERVRMWRERWPQIAAQAPRDAAAGPPKYSFFYPEEEYRPAILDSIGEMVRMGIGDVEVHIHHDGGDRAGFLDRMQRFMEVLHARHGLLRKQAGRFRFGFIHGNWALDNSMPLGKGCGLNDELTILKEMGCYADFTMPSGNSPSQARTLNRIYWATDDPAKPKSYDRGREVKPGQPVQGDLLMITGPFGLRWGERLLPRLETGEIAGYDVATPSRVRLWFNSAPMVGEDLFLKLYTHGTQERNSSVLLKDGLANLFTLVAAEARRRNIELHYATAWEMYGAVEAARQGTPAGAGGG